MPNDKTTGKGENNKLETVTTSLKVKRPHLKFAMVEIISFFSLDLRFTIDYGRISFMVHARHCFVFSDLFDTFNKVRFQLIYEIDLETKNYWCLTNKLIGK